MTHLQVRRKIRSVCHGVMLLGLLVAVPASARSDDVGDAAGEICARLAAETVPGLEGQDREAVNAFYSARSCRPLWVDEHGPTEVARLAIDEIGHAAEWGLNAADFKLGAVKAPADTRHWTSAEAASAEIELTAAILRYAHQAEGGRIPTPDKLLSSYLDREPVLTSAADVLAATSSAADPGAVMRSYQPSQDQFLKLKDLLAQLRAGTPAAKPVDFPREGAMLQIGVKNSDVAALRKRLGVAASHGNEEVFDEALADAVKTFQQSAGMRGDGIVGPSTRAALAGEGQGQTKGDNASKIAAVIANMEEWRWMPRSLGPTHIVVNVPSFSIVLMDKDRPVFEERVIVGTPATQTPIFSKDMTTIVLRPQWYLPDSIKLSKLLAGRSLEQQGYLIKRNGRVVSSAKVNWSKANLKEYEIYQPSGDDNALGLVKLLFPNKHSVYLHDTPSKSLFNEPVRLFSHGCMRVRNPQELAQQIFDIDRGPEAPDVKALVRKGPMSNEFALNHPIPVHVGYFTVWVDDKGEAHYYNDYYGHQQRITLALAGRWNEIDVGRDHLAAVDTSALKGIKFEGEMGLTNADGGSYATGDSVGDMIRRSLGF